MASLAQTLIQGSQEAIKAGAPDILGAIQTGASIAAKREELKLAQQQNAQQQEALNFKNLEAVPKRAKAFNEAKTPIQAKFAARGYIAALESGLGTKIHPDTAKLLLDDRDTLLEVNSAIEGFLAQKKGQISTEELNGLRKLAEVDPHGFIDTVKKFNITARAEAAKDRRAEIAASATRGNQANKLRTDFINSKDKLLVAANNSGIKMREIETNLTSARRLFNEAKKTGNLQAYNQGVKALIRLNEARISDMDVRLFAGQTGMGKIGPYLQELKGLPPDKTINNAIKVLDIIIAGKTKGFAAMRDSLKQRAVNISKLPGAFEGSNTIIKDLGLTKKEPSPALKALLQLLKERKGRK